MDGEKKLTVSAWKPAERNCMQLLERLNIAAWFLRIDDALVKSDVAGRELFLLVDTCARWRSHETLPPNHIVQLKIEARWTNQTSGVPGQCNLTFNSLWFGNRL